MPKQSQVMLVITHTKFGLNTPLQRYVAQIHYCIFFIDFVSLLFENGVKNQLEFHYFLSA